MRAKIQIHDKKVETRKNRSVLHASVILACRFSDLGSIPDENNDTFSPSNILEEESERLQNGYLNDIGTLKEPSVFNQTQLSYQDTLIDNSENVSVVKDNECFLW